VSDDPDDWIFLFGPAHTHPETGEPLIGRYVRIREPLGEASERMASMFGGSQWSHSVPASELGRIVSEYGTRELPEFRWPGYAGAQPEAVMQTREQVVAAIRAATAKPPQVGTITYLPWGFPCIDGRDRARLADWLPLSDWDALGLTLKEGATHEPQPWTREAIVEQLKRDLAFGFDKALGKRGISSELMATVVKMWLWVLGDPLHDTEDYPMYGLPLFKRVAVKYGFDNPIGDATGREDRFGEDSSARDEGPQAFSRYMPEITAFALGVEAKAAYCFVLEGKKGTGGSPMVIGMPPREEYERLNRELVVMLRRSADLLEGDLRRQGFR
jgi:hypothetical protein